MRALIMAVLCLAAASLAFGQIQSETFTVQASRSPQLTPDRIVFDVTVTAGLNTSFEQALTALQGLGITAAEFSGPSFPNRDSVDWSFSLAVPFAKMKATLASLTSLQQSISTNNSGLKLSFRVQGSAVSPELQSQPCSTNDLIADAQTQAQKLASAAGFTVGPIVSISKQDFAAVASPPATGFWFSTTPAFRTITLGQFIYTQALVFAAPQSVANCSVEVRFTLLRYH